MGAFSDWLSAQAEKTRQNTEIQRNIWTAQHRYALYALVVMQALNSETVSGVVAPADLSEIITLNNTPSQFTFHVVIVRGTGANVHAETSIKSAIYSQLSRTFNVDIATVKKANRISIVGDNIIIRIM